VKPWVAVFGIGLVFFVDVASADPLAGTWILNVGRTHYGGGAERRREETVACEAHGKILSCTIKSARIDGKRLVGKFTAAYDGKPYTVAGIPDTDAVILRKVDEHVVDASFTRKGRPVFGYRAVKSDDGRSLTIVSVSPESRTVLNSVVVYDRQ